MIATHGGGKRRWERLHTWEETKGRQYETTQQWIIHNLCGSASGGKQLTNLSLWSDRYDQFYGVRMEVLQMHCL